MGGSFGAQLGDVRSRRWRSRAGVVPVEDAVGRKGLSRDPSRCVCGIEAQERAPTRSDREVALARLARSPTGEPGAGQSSRQIAK